MDLRFPKEQHIFLRDDIEALLKEGEIFFRYPLKVYFAPRPGLEFSRAMFAAPKRNFKKAVIRNLLKRRMREAFRLNRHLLGDVRGDFYFIFVGKKVCDYGKIVSGMDDIFALVHKKDSQLSTDSSC